MADKLMELYAELSADTSKWTKGFASARKDLADTGKAAEGLDTQLMGMVSKWTSAISVASIGGFAIKAALDFEKAEFSIRRTTGAIGDNLTALKGSFETVYKTSGRSADEIAGALGKISVVTGTTGAALEALTSYTLKFAKVTGIDVQTAVQGTQAMFKKWDIDARDQAATMDTLYRVMQLTGIGFEKLSSSMTDAAPIMHTLGFSFEQTAAFVGMLEEKGVNAGEVLSRMSVVLAKLAKDTGSPVAALQNLTERIRGAKDNAEALHLVMAMGGKGGAAIVNWIDAIRRGGDTVEDFKAKLKAVTDTIGKAAEDSKSAGDKWTEMMHKLQAAALPAGTHMVDAFTGMVEEFEWEIRLLKDLWSWLDKVSLKSAQFNAMYPTLAPKTAGAITPGPARAPAAAPSALPPPPGAGLTPAEIKDRDKAAERSFEATTAMMKRYDEDFAEQIKLMQAGGKVRTDLDEADLQLYISEQQLNATLKAGGAIVKQANVDWSALKLTLADLPAKMQDLTLTAGAGFGKLQEAYKYFGLETTVGLEAIWGKSAEMYRRIADDADASMESVTRAWIKMERDSIAMLEAQGEAVDKSWKDIVDKVAGDLDTVTKHTKTIAEEVTEDVTRTVHGTFTGMSRGIAQNIVEWKGWGATLKSVSKDFATGMLEAVIHGFLRPLEDEVAKVVSRITKKLMDAIGIGGKTTGGAGAAAGGAASAGGGAASAAAGGAMGWIGAISGAVSAVSGVIGNFQMSGMNKSLDVIVNHTLVAANELQNLRADQWSRHASLFLKLDDLWNAIRNVGQVGSAARVKHFETPGIRIY
jgi:TP901 family phage tail tape measure protein